MSAIFAPERVIFAIITSYPEWYQGRLRSLKHTQKVRGDLALEFASQASKRGYRVICSDYRSAKTFQKQLATIPHVRLIKSKIGGSGRNKRVAIHEATKTPGVEAIVLSEPEKVSIVTDCLDQLLEPIFADKADIVVPKREDALFRETYPLYMYHSEVEANGLFNEALKANGYLRDKDPQYDHFFGPRVIRNNKRIIALFTKKYIFTGQSPVSKFFDPDVYSNVLFFPVVNALRKRLRVSEVIVPFRYPTKQKENEELGNKEAFVTKRNFQRISILVDLMHFISFLQGRRSSKLKIANI